MSLKITGLKELENKLKKMSADAKAAEGNHNVSFAELFSPAFMRRNTQFTSIDEMFEKSGFNTATPKDFKAIPDAELDAFVAAHTKFENWEAMKAKAGAEWMKKKLGF